MTSASEVEAALDADLGKLRDARVLAGIQAFRVTPPTPIRLEWDHGEPGETFDGWLVFEDAGRGAGIVYCDRAFLPTSPWGLITSGEPSPSMGTDAGWFRRFMDAYLDSVSATDLPIWRVVRWPKVGEGSREPITEELSWEEAWNVVHLMRVQDPAHAYECDHEIAF